MLSVIWAIGLSRKTLLGNKGCLVESITGTKAAGRITTVRSAGKMASCVYEEKETGHDSDRPF